MASSQAREPQGGLCWSQLMSDTHFQTSRLRPWVGRTQGLRRGAGGQGAGCGDQLSGEVASGEMEGGVHTGSSGSIHPAVPGSWPLDAGRGAARRAGKRETAELRSKGAVPADSHQTRSRQSQEQQAKQDRRCSHLVMRVAGPWEFELWPF